MVINLAIADDETTNKYGFSQLFRNNDPSFPVLKSAINIDIESFITTPQEDSIIRQNLLKPPQIFTFLTEDNFKLYGMIYKPYNFTKDFKYPTLLYVYAGPKAQIVSNSYKGNKLILF